MSTDRVCLPILAISLFAVSSALVAAPEGKVKKQKYTVVEILPVHDAACESGFQRFTYARRINESGMAVGYDDCYVATGDPAAPYLPRGYRAFRWSSATGATLLPAVNIDSTDALARDINEAGTTVGLEFTSDGGSAAAHWPFGGGAALAFDSVCNPWGFNFSRAEGINDSGAIAGSDFRPGENGCETHWILKRANGEEILGPVGGTPYHINNHEVLVGGTGGEVIRWSPAAGASVLATSSGPWALVHAWGVNDRNEVAGYRHESVAESSCTSSIDPVFWAADGAEVALPSLPGATRTTAFGINNRTEIVGDAQFVEPCEEDQTKVRAVIWRNGRIADLNRFVPKAFAREHQLTYASAINDRGQILVRGFRRDEARVSCPLLDFDPETGEPIYDDSRMCHNERAFLLTPRK